MNKKCKFNNLANIRRSLLLSIIEELKTYKLNKDIRILKKESQTPSIRNNLNLLKIIIIINLAIILSKENMSFKMKNSHLS